MSDAEAMLWALATSNDGAEHPSMGRIAEAAGLNIDAARAAVRELVRLGLVTRGQRWRRSTGMTTDIYRLSLVRHFEDDTL